jgi:hypothetical protein
MYEQKINSLYVDYDAEMAVRGCNDEVVKSDEVRTIIVVAANFFCLCPLSYGSRCRLVRLGWEFFRQGVGPRTCSSAASAHRPSNQLRQPKTATRDYRDIPLTHLGSWAMVGMLQIPTYGYLPCSVAFDSKQLLGWPGHLA